MVALEGSGLGRAGEMDLIHFALSLQAGVTAKQENPCLSPHLSLQPCSAHTAAKAPRSVGGLYPQLFARKSHNKSQEGMFDISEERWINLARLEKWGFNLENVIGTEQIVSPGG